MKQQHLGVRGTERNYTSQTTSHCFSAQHLLNHFFSLPPNFFFFLCRHNFLSLFLWFKGVKTNQKPVTRRKKKSNPKRFSLQDLNSSTLDAASQETQMSSLGKANAANNLNTSFRITCSHPQINF